MSNHNYDRFLFPEKMLGELLKKGAQGRYLDRNENTTLFYRATVLAVDVVGGLLENPNAQGSVTHQLGNKKIEVKARSGPSNPQNSVKARILTNGLDQFVDDNNLRVFWPFFSEHMSVPVKPGEHVYVMFEDAEMKHGLWVNKVPGHEGVNLVVGESKYESLDAGRLAPKFGIGKTKPEDPDNTDKFASESQINEQKLSGLFGLKG